MSEARTLTTVLPVATWLADRQRPITVLMERLGNPKQYNMSIGYFNRSGEHAEFDTATHVFIRIHTDAVDESWHQRATDTHKEGSGS